MAELSFLVLICKTLGGIYTCAKFCQFTDNLDEHDVNVSMFFFYIGTVGYIMTFYSTNIFGRLNGNGGGLNFTKRSIYFRIHKHVLLKLG